MSIADLGRPKPHSALYGVQFLANGTWHWFAVDPARTGTEQLVAIPRGKVERPWVRSTDATKACNRCRQHFPGVVFRVAELYRRPVTPKSGPIINVLLLNQTRRVFMARTILNEAGTEIDFDVAVNLMDSELCEALDNGHGDPTGSNDTPGDEQQFFEWYCRLHREKFGEEFEPNKRNPVEGCR